jgi:hypothetical protein
MNSKAAGTVRLGLPRAKYLVESSLSSGFLLLKCRSGFNLTIENSVTAKLGHSEEDDAIPH